MPTASKNNFLDHARWFRSACRDTGAEAIVSLDNWCAFVRQGERHLAFYPQFQASVDGRLQYQHMLTDDATMFAGWLPYRMKRWETAVDKLAFKRYAESVDLRVPRYWLDAAAAPQNVVVKSPKSSFGLGVSGPFRRAVDRPLDLTQGEYYEEFVGGDLLKIWYWNGRPICAEVDKMAFVYGDGASTVRALIEQLGGQWGPLSAGERDKMVLRCEPLVNYWGRKLDDVMPKGAKQVVEFRYGSRLMRPSQRVVLDLLHDPAPPWLAEASAAGARMYEAVPADIQKGTLFTLDAMLPADGQPRFLEANCNPTVHPLVYPVMTRELLGIEHAPADPVH
jgi:hypothetical protein